MKNYLAFFRSYRKAVLLAPLLVIVDVACEIVQPELMSKIVDLGVMQKDLDYTLRIGGFMVFLSLVAIAANVGNIYYSSHASVGFAAELRKGLFKKIQAFSFANLDKFSSASLTTRLTNDVNILQEVVMLLLRQLIRAPLMMLFAVVIAISINTGLVSVMVIAIPMLAFCIYIILRRCLPLFEKMQKRLDQVNGVIQENLVNVRVVKSFTREDFEQKKFGLTNDELREIAVKASGLVVLVMPIMQLVMNISIVAIIWFGGNKIIAGTFGVGQLMSFITYITQVLMSLTMLSMAIMTFSRAQASSVRILEVLHTDPDIVDSAAAIANNYQVRSGKIEFRNISFKYHPAGRELVLKNINLIAEPGQTIAILGATGSAKSTLVQLIPRLYDVSGGELLVDGINVRDYTLRNLRDQVKLVLQQNQLFSGTIRENIKWGNVNATDEEVIAAAKDAQAHDFIRSLPDGYSTVLGQAGVNISGGQKQRLCIARALLKKPAVLILDDSTSAVDIATEAKIRASFKRTLGGTTILIIAQRISSVRSADKIVLMETGEIAATGTHEELLQSNTLYQEIYASQQLETV